MIETEAKVPFLRGFAMWLHRSNSLEWMDQSCSHAQRI